MTVVKVRVLDVNDNSPTVNVQDFTASIDLTTPTSFVVPSLKVDDADTGENGQVSNVLMKIIIA